MQARKLGSTGPQVAQLGLGLMGMSDLYGPADRKESLATIRAAMEAGVTLLDTGDFYGMGHNELLVAEALAAGGREQVQISVKFGAMRDPAGNWIGIDVRAVRCRANLWRCGRRRCGGWGRWLLRHRGRDQQRRQQDQKKSADCHGPDT